METPLCSLWPQEHFHLFLWTIFLIFWEIIENDKKDTPQYPLLEL